VLAQDGILVLSQLPFLARTYMRILVLGYLDVVGRWEINVIVVFEELPSGIGRKR
jgi:hypothetical protein